MLKYCVKCGHRHEFTFDAPNFCEGCGNPFGNVTASTSPAPVVATRPQVKVAARYEEEVDDTPLPQITKLDVTIENFVAPKVTLDIDESGKSTLRGSSTMLGGERPRGTDFNPENVQRKFAELHRREQNARKEEITPD